MRKCKSCKKKIMSTFDITYGGDCIQCAVTREDDEALNDLTYLLQNAISIAVHDLVNRMTENTPVRVDMEVRRMLTESFRFWR